MPNPQYSVSMNSSAPAAGKLAAGAVTSYLSVDASSGAIAISPAGNTSAQFIPYNASRSSQVTISVTCTGTNCGKSTQTSTVTITGTGGTGRFGQINAFTAMFTGFTAVTSPSSSSKSSSSSSLSFTLAPFTGTKTFGLGMSIPVNTSGTLGVANSTYTVVDGNSTTGTATANGTVEGRLSITRNFDLSFGTLVLVTGKSGSAVWDASNQAFSLSPSDLAIPIHAGPVLGQFTVSGTPGQSLNFSVPASITMTNTNGDSLPITVATTGQGTQSLGTTGSFTFYVGGSIALTSTMPTGPYSGTFSVTANYQ